MIEKKLPDARMDLPPKVSSLGQWCGCAPLRPCCRDAMSSLARPPACARASLRRSAPRSAAESRAFRKYHGLGNDFVLVRPPGRPPARPRVRRAARGRVLGVRAPAVMCVPAGITPLGRGRPQLQRVRLRLPARQGCVVWQGSGQQKGSRRLLAPRATRVCPLACPADAACAISVQVDDRRGKAPSLTPEQAARACDRNFGVGGDGVIFALPPKEEGSDVTMRIYNSDGRCVHAEEGGRGGSRGGVAACGGSTTGWRGTRARERAGGGATPRALPLETGRGAWRLTALRFSPPRTPHPPFTRSRALSPWHSEPEMCGNGIRCLARFLYDVDLEAYKAAGSDGDAGDFSPALRTPSVLRIDTLAGLIVPEIVGDDVRVDMGEPILEAAAVPTALEPNAEGGACVKAPLEVAGKTWLVTTVSMGNPHAIVFGNTDEDITDVYAGIDLAAVGPQFESDAAFPARTNTEFVEVVSRDYCKMRVWERGAGPTLACGTGACATVVAGVLEGRLDRKCTVELPGGPLHIEWEEATNKIYMTGAACESFRGEAIFS